jgi:hypothetical protein
MSCRLQCLLLPGPQAAKTTKSPGREGRKEKPFHSPAPVAVSRQTSESDYIPYSQSVHLTGFYPCLFVICVPFQFLGLLSGATLFRLQELRALLDPCAARQDNCARPLAGTTRAHACGSLGPIPSLCAPRPARRSRIAPTLRWRICVPTPAPHRSPPLPGCPHA